jgi:hypothetical protein
MFTSPTRVPGTAGQDAEPPKVVRTANDVFILWHEFPDAAATQPDIFVARSTNGGSSFRPRLNLSNSPAAFSADEDMAVARVGDATRVYIAWIEDAAVLFRRDRTNDGTYSNALRLNDTVGVNSPTRVRVAAAGDNVFVVWQAEHPQPGDNTDIFYARSTDAGDTFKEKKNVSSNAAVSEFPDLTVLADNRVLITWRDNSTGDFEVFFVRGT